MAPALAKQPTNRADGDWQPFLEHLEEDVVFKVSIPESTPISGEFRGKPAVVEHFQRFAGLLEFEQERPVGFLGEGGPRLGLGQRDYGERHLEGG
jgi:uncharacterized protein